MKNIWVLGSSKSIGNYLAIRFSEKNKVLGFSRKNSSLENVNFKNLNIDLKDTDNFKQVVITELNKTIPDGIIFCQRYRSSHKGESIIPDIHNGNILELYPIIIIIEELKKFSINFENISIVLLTSIAGEFIHVDLPLYYHILKSNTLTINNYYSIKLRNSGIRINTIILGEFLKYNFQSYSESEKKKYELLKKFTNNSEIVKMEDIYNTINYLISNESKNLTGQTIKLDGNLSFIAQESIIRTFNNDNQ